jgi:hypothetical protein
VFIFFEETGMTDGLRLQLSGYGVGNKTVANGEKH